MSCTMRTRQSPRIHAWNKPCARPRAANARTPVSEGCTWTAAWGRPARVHRVRAPSPPSMRPAQPPPAHPHRRRLSQPCTILKDIQAHGLSSFAIKGQLSCSLEQLKCSGHVRLMGSAPGPGVCPPLLRAPRPWPAPPPAAPLCSAPASSWPHRPSFCPLQGTLSD